MAIALVNAGTVAENAVGTTTLNVPYPTGMTSTSYMVLWMTNSAANLPTLPGGWTSVFLNSVGAGANAPAMMVAIKQATGSESGNLAVTTPNNTSIGQILAFSGVDLVTPQDVTASLVDNSTASSTSVIPSITTTQTGCALIYCGAENSTVNTATISSVPAAFTETADKTGGGARSGTMGYLIWSGSGATGTPTITWTGSARNLGLLMALRPASAAVSDGKFFQMF